MQLTVANWTFHS